MSDWRVGVIATFAAFLSSAPASAQGVEAMLRGIATDHTGAVLPGATLTLTNRENGLVRTSVTDAGGRYQIPPVPAGIYDLTADAAGFRSEAHGGLVLHVGDTVTLDVVFDTVAATSAPELVTGSAVLETSANTLSRLVGKQDIDRLPVIDRHFNSLALLAPGVTATGPYGRVDVAGSRDFQNGYNVDGVSSEGLARGEERIVYAQDWIQEFQVLTSQYNVEFGRASGGILNAITRSGSNETAARAYGFFRNESWDAIPAFASSRAPLQMKRLGGTAGGRVIRDRLFFFGGFEWFDDETSHVVNSSHPEMNLSVPSTTDQKLAMLKIEGHPDDWNSWRVRYNADTNRRTNVGVGGIRTEGNGHSQEFTGHDVAGTWNRILSASVVNELRAGFNDTISRTGCNYAAHHPPGTWFQRSYPGAILGCPVQFGRINLDEFQILDNVSWTRGAHTVKTGFMVSHARSHGDYNISRFGVYTFERDDPFSLTVPATYPSRFMQVFGPTIWDYSRISWAAFVQDSWRVTPDLTVNLGVRYDLDGGYTALNQLTRTDEGLGPVRVDANNIAPRVGAAWTPFRDDKRTLVRAGAGIYHDESHAGLAGLIVLNSILVERSVRLVATDPGLNPFWPDVAALRRVLADALAANTAPDLSFLPRQVGGVPDLDNALQVPYTLQASGGISRTLRPGLSVSADVLVSRGFDQYTLRDTNIDRDAALRLGRVVRPNPSFGPINTYGNDGRFVYRALLVQVNATPSAGHSVQLSYTLSKNEGTTSAALDGGGRENRFAVTNPFDDEEDFGPGDNDVRHNLTVNWVTRLPFAFQLSGLALARSALPWSVSLEQLDSDPFMDRPEPRNSRRGDPYFSLDTRLGKVFRLRSRRSLEAFVEVFNVTNATNLTEYITRRTAAQFGQPAAALERRRVQLGIRADF
jgi:hypothetical protein